MTEICQVHSDCELETFCSLKGPGVESPSSVSRHAADAHWMVLREGAVSARCSLWWSSTPACAGERVGAIGHFAASQGDAGVLLVHACGELARHGCTVAVGPMDGNTWRRYRVVTERGEYPPFFLEPNNPDDWPLSFTGAGFTPLAEYYSARTGELAIANPRIEAVWRRLLQQGLSVRHLDGSDIEKELESLYDLAIASFGGNFLYSPLAKEEFLAQYRTIMPYVRPELVLIAERAGKPVGFLFAVPDHLESRSGKPTATFIVKTLAVHPAFSGRGLGSVLLWHVNRAAYSLGYRAAIHALMHQGNQSVRISAREGFIFRRYTLYSRALKAMG